MFLAGMDFYLLIEQLTEQKFYLVSVKTRILTPLFEEFSTYISKF